MTPDELRSLRESLGLLVYEFASLIPSPKIHNRKIDKTTLGLWERGNNPITERMEFFIRAAAERYLTSDQKEIVALRKRVAARQEADAIKQSKVILMKYRDTQLSRCPVDQPHQFESGKTHDLSEITVLRERMRLISNGMYNG